MEKELNIKSSLYDYSVLFVNDFSQSIREFEGNNAYVIDRNVYELYKDKFTDVSLEHVFFMDAVEHKKNMDTVMEIIRFWKSINVRKDWKVICFGGGITQDVTTIASNLYLRNIDWYFFPTTLLSMCDSCIGGKCGINLDQYKNQIGVFYPPKKIFIDPCFIGTLSKGDVINGWGELLKFSLTSNPAFYEQLSREKDFLHCDNFAQYIYEGLLVKKEIIEEDEFESDLRRVLNYGHTFGHALEAYTHNEIPHGQGVIWGIDVVNYIAVQENLISRDYYLEIKELIKRAFLTTEVVVDEPNRLFEIIKTDKKVKKDTLFFALLKDRSKLCVYPLKIDEKLREYFKEYLKETHEYYCD